MDPLEFASAADQLVEVVRSRTATLVIGAGASVSSGLPTSSQLVEELRAAFPLAHIPDNASFLDAGTAICNTAPYGRMRLVSHLKTAWQDLEPSSSYKQLPRWYWRGIFTTNYDDLVEKAYRTPTRVQTLQPIHLPDTGSIARQNHLYLFHLQGSITQPAESDGSPAVSWGDYHKTVQDRIPVMNLLRNVMIDGGLVIYVGYSFNDFFLDGILDEVSRRLGARNMPYGYALLPDWPTDAGQRHKVTRHNVIPVRGSFEEFADLVDQVATHGHQRRLEFGHAASPAAGYQVAVGGGSVAFTETEFGVYSEFFELLDDSQTSLASMSPSDEAVQAREFLQGEIHSWKPYRRGWAFKRAGYLDLLDQVRERFVRPRPADSRVLLVHGPAGLGKSVMARQLAYDLYTKSDLVPLLAKPGWRVRPDAKLLDRFFDDLEQKLPEGSGLPGVVLIVDEAELVDRTLPYRIAKYLHAMERPFLVVLFGRTNEYYRSAIVGDKDVRERWGEPTDIALSETLSDDEIVDLVKHLENLNIWAKPRVGTRSFWVDYVRREHSSSFFDTVYALVQETQQPLAERVKSEYDNLSDVGREAYKLIAATHQYGLLLKLEVLMRVLKVDWARFEAEVIRSDAQAVLFAEQITNDLNVNFRGRTRMISEIVFTYAVKDHKNQFELFKQLIGAFNPNDMFGIDELDTVRTLLIQVLGPSGFDRRFGSEELGELFAAATALVEDDVLEHHYGLVERDARRLVSARAHLEKALRLTALLPDDLAVQRESPQNIENSLAQVIGDLAMEALMRGAGREADELLAEATRRFKGARLGTFPNAAAYDAHARLLRTHARRRYAQGSAERAVGLSDALDVLDEGMDNVNAEHRTELADLKAEILQELGVEDQAVTELAQRTEVGTAIERARYHAIIARILTSGKYPPKRKVLQRAFSHAVNACELDPKYFGGQRLRAELFKELFPEDIAGLHKHLLEAERCEEARANAFVLYELGVTSFYLQRYRETVDAFGRLRRISRGSSFGVGVIESAGERGGEDSLEYEGRVGRRADGKLVIECEELKELGPIWFNPRAERYYTPRLRDSVLFLVGFNHRGIQATDIKRT